MPCVFVTGWIPEDCVARLRAIGDVEVWGHDEPPTESDLVAVEADVLVSLLTAPITDAVLAGRSLVAQVAVGVDNIDLAAANRRGVPVTHTPGVLTDATADLTLALLLATTRRLVEADRYVRGGHWERWRLDLLCGLELSGATLGIVGFGRIGEAVAHRARSFGMRILATGPRAIAPERLARVDARQVSLNELLGESDVVSLHAPLTAESRHLLDADALRAMKRGAYLLNTARGPLIDEDALADALESGHLAGAGLDVHEREPAVHPRLAPRRDVVLLPHIGSATTSTRYRMADLAVESVESWASGSALPRLVAGWPAEPA